MLLKIPMRLSEIIKPVNEIRGVEFSLMKYHGDSRDTLCTEQFLMNSDSLINETAINTAHHSKANLTKKNEDFI